MEQDLIEIFQNEEFGNIRTSIIDNKPYFVASDVAKALGYTNPNKAVNDHCRAITKRSTPISGKMQEINFIPEGDIYRLVVKSKLPTAEKFETWIFDEVLPSIRKHGGYLTPQKIEDILADPDTIIQLATSLKEERLRNSRLQTKVAIQEQQIAELNPKGTYYDLVLQCKDLLSVTQIAKDYGRSAKWLNSILSEQKVQFKRDKMWFLYNDYAKMGYTQSKTQPYTDNKGNIHTSMHTYWTQKGGLFIYDMLKNLGILPIIERGRDGVC